MRRLGLLVLLCLVSVRSSASADPIPHLYCAFGGAWLGGAPTIPWSGQEDLAYGCFYDLPGGLITTAVYVDDELIQTDAHRVSAFTYDSGAHGWMIPKERLTDCCVEPRIGRLEVDVPGMFDPRLYAFSLVQPAQVLEPIPEPATLLLLGPALVGLWRHRR